MPRRSSPVRSSSGSYIPKRSWTASNTAAQAGSPPAIAVSCADGKSGVRPPGAACGSGGQEPRSTVSPRSASTTQARVRRGVPPADPDHEPAVGERQRGDIAGHRGRLAGPGRPCGRQPVNGGPVQVDPGGPGTAVGERRDLRHAGRGIRLAPAPGREAGRAPARPARRHRPGCSGPARPSAPAPGAGRSSRGSHVATAAAVTPARASVENCAVSTSPGSMLVTVRLPRARPYRRRAGGLALATAYAGQVRISVMPTSGWNRSEKAGPGPSWLGPNTWR